MARNKYPEKTIQKILDVSLLLFSKKGYDKTSIQDIVNEIGMSKGAIYHHFKSKEEILDALGKRFYDDAGYFDSIAHRKDLNGLEKIREVFIRQISDANKEKMDALTINIWKEPKFFMMSMEENLRENAAFLVPFLEEGIQDGSIRKQNTKNASEVLILLLNYWVFSPITGYRVDELKSKIHYLRIISDNLGIPIINDEIEEKTNQYFEKLSKYIE